MEPHQGSTDSTILAQSVGSLTTFTKGMPLLNSGILHTNLIGLKEMDSTLMEAII